MLVKRGCAVAFVLLFFLSQAVYGDLVGYWNFDGNVEDHSGAGNDGELIDAVYSDNVPSVIGAGQSLDFSNDTDHVYIEADDSLDSDVFTLSLFVNDRGQVGAFERFTSRESDTFETAINVHPPFGGTGEISYYSGAGGGWQWTREENGAEDNIVLELDTWQHVAYVANPDDETMTIYLDGELILESLDPWFTTPTGFMHIGNRWNDVEGFDGLLDDVALWDEVLTQEQIATIASKGVACFLGNCGEVGDYNGNGEFDAGDLDVQAQYILDNDPAGDLNGDGTTDINDRVAWITDIQKSWVGDSNFDGEFSSTDFVVVFGAAKYETDQEATYVEGDWNGDKLFNSSDFVAAFTAGGYELGPLPAAAVPEPSCSALALLFAFALFMRNRR
ncbi:MAG: hypothetical protein KDB27_15410 [Planctomycetales bacterium]|nr:hypothetical protein [Planctomycetales bacterium]